MHLGAFLWQMKLGCEARDHFRRHEFAVGSLQSTRARRDEHGARRGAVPRRMLEIQSGVQEIYTGAPSGLLLARVLINRTCPLTIP